MNESSDASLKQCSKCEQVSLAIPQFFSRDRTKQDGLHTTCKICDKARKKAYLETHKDLVHQQKKQSRGRNKEHIAAYKKQWQQGESYKSYQKWYYQEHLEEIHTGKRQNYLTNREQWLEKQKLYSRTPQGRLVDKAHRHKRKAQKKASKGSYTPQQLQEQMQRQKSRCYYCKVKLHKIWHADHVVPLSRGGSNDISNIVIACPACNLSKHARLPHEWPEGNRLL